MAKTAVSGEGAQSRQTAPIENRQQAQRRFDASMRAATVLLASAWILSLVVSLRGDFASICIVTLALVTQARIAAGYARRGRLLRAACLLVPATFAMFLVYQFPYALGQRDFLDRREGSLNDTGVDGFIFLGFTPIAVFFVGVYLRVAARPPGTTVWQAVRCAVLPFLKFVGRIWLIVGVIVTLTAICLTGGDWNFVASIAAILILCPLGLSALLAVWTGVLAAAYHLRDERPTTPWQAWGVVRIATPWAILVGGCAWVWVTPYFATRALLRGGAEIDEGPGLNLANPIQVREVVASATEFDPTSLSHVGRLYGAVFLTLAAETVDDRAIESLRDARNVSSLTLTSPNLTDECLKTVATLSWLNSLEIEGTRINGSGMAHLSKLDGLQYLEIKSCAIGHEGWKAIGSLNSVRSLTLTGVSLDRLDLAAIAENRELTYVTLQDVTLSPNALRGLKWHHRWRLELRGSSVDRRHLADLRYCRNLTSLDLNRRGITDDDLIYLVSLPWLSELDLSGNPIQGDSLWCLSVLPGLRSVNLSDTLVDDEAIFELTNLGVRLNTDNTRVSPLGQWMLEDDDARRIWAVLTDRCGFVPWTPPDEPWNSEATRYGESFRCGTR